MGYIHIYVCIPCIINLQDALSCKLGRIIIIYITTTPPRKNTSHHMEKRMTHGSKRRNELYYIFNAAAGVNEQTRDRMREEMDERTNAGESHRLFDWRATTAAIFTKMIARTTAKWGGEQLLPTTATIATTAITTQRPWCWQQWQQGTKTAKDSNNDSRNQKRRPPW